MSRKNKTRRNNGNTRQGKTKATQDTTQDRGKTKTEDCKRQMRDNKKQHKTTQDSTIQPQDTEVFVPLNRRNGMLNIRVHYLLGEKKKRKDECEKKARKNETRQT